MKKKLSNLILVLSFNLILFTMFLSYIFLGDRTFSENENRYLKTRPKFTCRDLFSGKYTRNLESYADDQILFRDKLMEGKTKILKSLGIREINGIYVTRDNYLIEIVREEDFDYTGLEKNIGNINKFAKKYEDKDIQVLIAPTSSLILSGKLPKNILNFDENKAYKIIGDSLEVKFIDPRKILLNKNQEDVYYRTDHHWTSLGAYYGYKAYAFSNNLPVDNQAYKIERVTSDFKGTFYSKILDRDSLGDEIYIFKDKNIGPYKLHYNFKEFTKDSVYDLEKLQEKDKYKVFLGGNYPEIEINTGSVGGGNLLIFKDSYGNSFIPFLLKNYENIYVIDLRYFKEDLKNYMDKREIDNILFLYNLKNFASEKSLNQL